MIAVALAFLRRNWKPLVIAAAIGFLAMSNWMLRAELATRTAELTAEQLNHLATVANHKAATAEARRLDVQNVARVKADQSKITEEIVDGYEARLADARARAAAAERLRAQAAAANPGRGGDAGMPRAGPAAEGVDQAPGEDRLSPSDALTCTEQALQLDSLIDWTEAQALVDFNAEPSP